jgi:phthalate 4,5-dioxygenase oxygenase subunit
LAHAQLHLGGASVHVKVDADDKPLLRKENKDGMDRDAQRKCIFYSGIEGIGIQDASRQESMGSAW